MGLSVHLALLAVQLMFASLSPVAKIALREIPPFGLIAFRAPAAAALLLLLASVRGWAPARSAGRVATSACDEVPPIE